MIKQAWDRKYLPTKASEYIYQDEEQKQIIENFLKEKAFPHLLLFGHRGTGKSSLAYLLKSELAVADTDFLKINCSEQTGIETVKTTVKSFISSMSMSWDYKIVFLDEADRLSPAAQDALKGMMEDYSDNSRFIFTSNKPHKIIPELKSRCLEIKYESINKNEMVIRFGEILSKEKVSVASLDILDEYVDACYPDFRKLLINAQSGVRNGILVPYQEKISDTSEYMVNVIEFIQSDNWEAAREYLAKNVPDDKWEECYRFLYDYLHEIGKFKDIKKWKAGIIIISDSLYRHSMAADPEICFASCLIRLTEV